MNNRKIFCILCCLLTFSKINAQNKGNRYLSASELIGVWQRDAKSVGNGLNQNFHFDANGKFLLNLGDDRDDLRDVMTLKGKYRLSKDSLFFTILSKTVTSGKIAISDGGIGLNLFTIEGGKISEIKEANPKELTDPVYITVLSSDHIKLSSEEYYKITSSK